MSKRLIFSRAAALPVGANREFALPADGWFQLATPGEVRAPMESDDPDTRPVEVVQVFDAEAANRVLAKFREVAAQPNFGGVLVDFEHFSYEPDKETRAAMWIDEMQVRNGAELWIKPRITNSGREALEGGDYRHISPVFVYPDREYKAGERVRPEALDTAGLTNRPRLKGMRPLSNRQTAATAERSETQQTPPMKKLLKLLGLADDASEDSAVAAFQVIKNKADQIEPLTKERDTLLSEQVERDLDDAGLEGDSRSKWKARLIANRADTLPLLADVKAAREDAGDESNKGAGAGKSGEGYRVVHNREKTKQPGSVTTQTADEKKQQAEEARAAKIRNRASELQASARQAGRSLSFSQAWSQAEAEIPSAS